MHAWDECAIAPSIQTGSRLPIPGSAIHCHCTGRATCEVKTSNTVAVDS